jgi:hypothetical protein
VPSWCGAEAEGELYLLVFENGFKEMTINIIF